MEPEPSERDWADLAALADGTLPEERRPGVEARVDASPALQEALARQRSALAEIRAVSDDRAPEGLRAWLTAQPVPEEPLAGPRRPRRWVPRLAAAGLAAAAVAVALVLSLGGAPPGERLAEATASAQTKPFAPDTPLHLYVDDVRFPVGERWQWMPTGSKEVEVEGQTGLVVAYERDGRTLDYAIVARPALDLPEGKGPYHAFTYDGRPAVMWHREGRTCLLLGDERTSTDELRMLAKMTKYY